MQQTALSPSLIEREMHIAASPETVYGFFTDPEKIVRWMGRKAEADARPGGTLRLDYNGFDIMRGQFTELVPHSRVVFTWGWETLGDATPPGASTVEVTLTPDQGGTLLRLVHSGLSDAERASHAEGWDMFLPGLVSQAEGAPAPAPTTPLSPGEDYASRLNTALVELRHLVEDFPESRWGAIPEGEKRAAGVIAHHVVGHLALVGFVQAVGAGQRSPLADLTLDALEAGNADHATQMAGVSRETVLGELKTEGPRAVEAMKALSNASLERTQPMTFAGGMKLSARQLAEGPLLSDIATHVAAIRSVC